ncbi:ATP-dependent DNA ligase [Candidatus Woesearchaeota archaeon]|nr:ATP-dependent DNA ligase [Candidatus Woesearchaeota archaeon]
MGYSSLVEVYKALESTSKRLEKTEIISEFLKKTNKEEIKTIIYLLEGRVFPEYDERKIGFSTRLMIKAISTASGKSVKEIEASLNKLGDLGLIAEEVLKTKVQFTLTKKSLGINNVFSNIQKLSTLEGQGTISKKTALVIELLTHSSPEESKYIVKTILEKLRIGIAKGIVRDAIAKAYSLDPKEIEKVADITGDYGEVAELAISNNLKEVKLSPNKPLNSMLAIVAKNVNETFEALGKPAQFEYKIDGFRLQAQKSKSIRLYTRRMENVTRQFPEIVEYLNKYVSAHDFILDAEAVAFDQKTGRHKSFQTVSQRIKRKYNIEEMAKKFPVELNIFDIMYYNGKSVVDKPLKERRKILESIVKQKKRKIVLTEKLVTLNPKEAGKFFKRSINEGYEGIMAKNLNSSYKPGRYVNGWMKIKKILDPLDLVITKSEFGEGKRAGWLTSYTVACKDKNKLLELGKVSTGVKEKTAGLTYNELTKLLKPLILEKKGKEVIVEPKIIIEVAYEEIQESQKYSSGYGLRFPRVLRLRMNEKTIKDIDDITKVIKVYNSQKGKK